MTIAEIIKRRSSISYSQERQLVEIISYRCSKEVKEQIRIAVRNRFYTTFEGKRFSNWFDINGVEVSYTGKMPMAEIRKEILG